ncbi:MAG: hypothetical protein LUD48_05290 [Prevotella sp.]|nr:hypothetical protein [Prevotella sp.]
MGKNTILYIFSKAKRPVWNSLPILLLCLSAAILSFSFASCSNDDLDETDLQYNLNNVSQVPLNFKLSATRSISGEGYVDATTNENNISSYRIYFFNSEDDTYITAFYPDSISTSDTVTYNVSGMLRKTFVDSLSTIYNNKFNIVVIGNWEAYPEESDFIQGTTTIENLCKGEVGSSSDYAKFTCPNPDSFELNDVSIPVYGVHSYTDVSFGQNTTLVDSITMLKAMAKVEVVDSTISTRNLYYPNIKSAKIIHYNAKGYCAPSGVNSENDLDEDGYTITVNLIDDANDIQVAETDTLDMFYDEVNDKWIAYVPEYSNTGDGVDKCLIEIIAECVGDKDGDVENDYDYTDYLSNPYKLYFCKYDEDGDIISDSDYDLKRNHLYRFSVRFPKIYMLEGGNVSAEEWHSKKR